MLHRIIRISLLSLALVWCTTQTVRAEIDESTGKALPLPRFVSLKSDEINVRVGPGTRYSISWVFRKEDYPVEIIQEFDQWREIRDHEGSIGWVHKNMLQGKRHVVVTGDVRTLRRIPDVTSPPVIRAEPGVIGQLIECKKDWCRLQIDSRKGWLPKTQIWGVYPKEEFTD